MTAENTPLTDALAALYPSLGPTQLAHVATEVEKLVAKCLTAPPWVSTTLKKARNKAGMTQTEVATALDWSLSKVIRIENGFNGIKHTDLTALIELYGIDSEKTRQRLIDECYKRRHARRTTAPAGASVSLRGR